MGKLDLLIVIFAAIAAWAAGAVYYMVLSRPWLAVSGVKVDNTGRPANASAAPYIISGIAMVVIAGMMRHMFQMAGIDDLAKGLVSGIGIGAFIITPWIVINYTYAQRPAMLSVIDGGYAILACTIIGTVLGATG